MKCSPRYAVPAALAVACAILSPLLKAHEAGPQQAGVAAPAAGHEAQAGLLTVTVLNPGAVATHVSSESCIVNWSDAGPIVRREGLVTMERVSRLARDRESLEIVNSALCKVESGYVYRLRVRGIHVHGRAVVKTMFVDARDPFAR